MPVSEQILFDQLKKEIADTYRKAYPSCIIPIEDWKGQDIQNFQEELIAKVKGRISEKWFYTHIKSKGDKLPRIDMLNMLSEYAGFQDWRDFTSKKQDFTKEKEVFSVEPIIKTSEKEVKAEISPPVKQNASKVWLILVSGILIITLFFFLKDTSKTYRCCFADLNGRALIANANIEVRLLKELESPAIIECDNNQCFEVKTNENPIRFLVRSPYYKTDTITRFLNKSINEEKVKLRTNDYALMIHYFSTSNLVDWKQRRTQLEDMIAQDAKILQVYVDGSGMELYNKEEFINKLTMPLKSLRNIEIIETRYSENQISLLRFMQVEQKNEP